MSSIAVGANPLKTDVQHFYSMKPFNLYKTRMHTLSRSKPKATEGFKNVVTSGEIAPHYVK